MNYPRIWRVSAACGILWITAAAAFADDDKEVKIKLKDAPAAVQKTLQLEALLVSENDKVTKTTKDGTVTYKVHVTINDESYGIEVAEDGTLLEKELDVDDDIEIKLSEAPALVQKTLKREAHGAEIDDVERKSVDGNVYMAYVKIDGTICEIVVAEDGHLIVKVLEEPEEEHHE
jgi:hypothetical protein